MATELEFESKTSERLEFAKLIDQDFKDRKLKENQIIKAKVIEKLKSYVVCDAKFKSEAMIPVSEFSEEELNKLNVGDTINCFVERLEGRSGEIILSYRKSKSFAAWEKCIKAFENEEELIGVIKNKIKGGFVCELFDGAISAFLPQSHLDVKPIRGASLDSLMRTPIKCRIVRLEKSRGNVSVSRKEVLLKNQNAEIKKALKNIKEGDIIENAIVKAIPDGKWGAFLDLGNNCTALLHQSDISHNRISSVTDILSVGQKIPKVKISKIDEKTNRISASIKLLTESPYEKIEKHLEEGKIYEGTVSKIVEYGAFVSISTPTLDANIEALCHSSELSYTNRTIKPSKVLSVSQKAKFKIITIDKENKKISVSYKQCLDNPWEKIKQKINSTAKFKINNITDKALFGELGDYGITTMLHWKELSFAENIEELKKYKKNQIIDVKIISVEDEKVKVSRRALDKDPWDYFKENNKSIGDVITTRVVEVLKSGAIKVSADPDKKIISTIKKSDLALDAADARSDIFSGGEKLDAKLLELDYKKRIIRLSPKEAQKDEQASLIKKFGKNASKSGQTLASIFKKAIGKKEKK